MVWLLSFLGLAGLVIPRLLLVVLGWVLPRLLPVVSGWVLPRMVLVLLPVVAVGERGGGYWWCVCACRGVFEVFSAMFFYMYENIAEFCLLGCSRHAGADDKKAQPARVTGGARESIRARNARRQEGAQVQQAGQAGSRRLLEQQAQTHARGKAAEHQGCSKYPPPGFFQRQAGSNHQGQAGTTD